MSPDNQMLLLIFVGMLPVWIGVWTLKAHERKEHGCPCCGR